MKMTTATTSGVFCVVVVVVLMAEYAASVRYRNVDCSNDSNSVSYCDIPLAYPEGHTIAKMISNDSSAFCQYYVPKGSTFIVLSPGCGGRFRTVSCEGYTIADCASKSGEYKECAVGIYTPKLLRFVMPISSPISGKSAETCTPQQYGIDGNKIWVSNGCNSTFSVCFRPYWPNN